MLVSFVLLMRIAFSFHFRTDGFDLFYNDNIFGHATLNGDFMFLDLDNAYDNSCSTFISYFVSNSESFKWHAQLSHVMDRQAKEGILDQLTRGKLPRFESCLVGKATIKPFIKDVSASSPL